MPIDKARIAREAAENPEPECLCMVIADNSGSMAGEPIRQLNEALPILRSELIADPLAAKRVRLAIHAFPPDGLITDFVLPEGFDPPALNTGGNTPLGATARKALKLVRTRMAAVQAEGTRVFRPSIYILSDGAPTDSYEAAAAELAAADKAGEINVFAIAIGDADLGVLAKFTHNFPPVPLQGLKFAELFRWISVNAKAQSHSTSHTRGKTAENARTPLTSIRDWAKLKGA